MLERKSSEREPTEQAAEIVEQLWPARGWRRRRGRGVFVEHLPSWTSNATCNKAKIQAESIALSKPILA